MSNEHIGRREAIGIGKESPAGTNAAPDIYVPKEGGVLNPQFTRDEDKSARGTIFSVLNKATVEKFTLLALPAVLSDDFFGYLLLAALGKATEVVGITLTGASSGTPARGDAISSAAGSWTGKIKKITKVGSTDYFWIEELTGTIDAQTDVTDGTWTGGTSAVKLATGGHFFEVAQTNTHQTFSLYGSGPIGDEVARWGMIDSLDINAIVGKYVRFGSNWMAKAISSTSGLSPAYVDENQFLAKHASVKFAANEAALNAAAVVSLQSFNLTIAKAVARTFDLGDADVSVLNNLGFGLTGDFDAIFRDLTLRNYVINDDTKAVRFALIQSNAAKVYDASGDDIYPSMYVDLDKISFDSAPKTDGNDEIVKQTVEFTALPESGVMIEVLLVNTNLTGY